MGPLHPVEAVFLRISKTISSLNPKAKEFIPKSLTAEEPEIEGFSSPEKGLRNMFHQQSLIASALSEKKELGVSKSEMDSTSTKKKSRAKSGLNSQGRVPWIPGKGAYVTGRFIPDPKIRVVKQVRRVTVSCGYRFSLRSCFWPSVDPSLDSVKEVILSESFNATFVDESYSYSTWEKTLGKSIESKEDVLKELLFNVEKKRSFESMIRISRPVTPDPSDIVVQSGEVLDCGAIPSDREFLFVKMAMIEELIYYHSCFRGDVRSQGPQRPPILPFISQMLQRVKPKQFVKVLDSYFEGLRRHYDFAYDVFQDYVNSAEFIGRIYFWCEDRGRPEDYPSVTFYMAKRSIARAFSVFKNEFPTLGYRKYLEFSRRKLEDFRVSVPGQFVSKKIVKPVSDAASAASTSTIFKVVSGILSDFKETLGGNIAFAESLCLFVIGLWSARSAGQVVIAMMNFAKQMLGEVPLSFAMSQLLKDAGLFGFDDIEIQAGEPFSKENFVSLFDCMRAGVANFGSESFQFGKEFVSTKLFGNLKKLSQYFVGKTLFEAVLHKVPYGTEFETWINSVMNKETPVDLPGFLGCIASTIFEAGKVIKNFLSGKPLFGEDKAVVISRMLDQIEFSVLKSLSVGGKPKDEGPLAMTFQEKSDMLDEVEKLIHAYSEEVPVKGVTLPHALRFNTRLAKARADLITEMRSLGSKMQPYVMTFVGAPGVGKSTCVRLVHSMIGSLLELPTDGNSMYVMNPMDKFHSAFKGTEYGMLIDDFLNKNPDYATDDAQLQILFEAIGTIPVAANMAELEKKGKMFMNFMAVYLTANTFETVVNKVFMCPGAVYRRLGPIVQVSLNAAYADSNGCLNMKKYSDEIRSGGLLESPWTFTMMKWKGDSFVAVPVSPGSGKLNFDVRQLLAFVRDEFKTHVATAQLVEEVTKESLSSCPECRLPMAFHLGKVCERRVVIVSEPGPLETARRASSDETRLSVAVQGGWREMTGSTRERLFSTFNSSQEILSAFTNVLSVPDFFLRLVIVCAYIVVAQIYIFARLTMMVKDFDNFMRFGALILLLSFLPFILYPFAICGFCICTLRQDITPQLMDGLWKMVRSGYDPEEVARVTFAVWEMRNPNEARLLRVAGSAVLLTSLGAVGWGLTRLFPAQEQGGVLSAVSDVKGRVMWNHPPTKSAAALAELYSNRPYKITPKDKETIFGRLCFEVDFVADGHKTVRSVAFRYKEFLFWNYHASKHLSKCDKVVLRPIVNSSNTLIVPIEFSYSQLKTDERNDLSSIRVSPIWGRIRDTAEGLFLPSFKGVETYLTSEAEFYRPGHSTPFRPCKAWLGRIRPGAAGYSPIWGALSFEYDIVTEFGDCGSLLVIVINGIYKIVSFHCGLVTSACIGFGRAISCEILDPMCDVSNDVILSIPNAPQGDFEPSDISDLHYKSPLHNADKIRGETIGTWKGIPAVHPQSEVRRTEVYDLFVEDLGTTYGPPEMRDYVNSDGEYVGPHPDNIKKMKYPLVPIVVNQWDLPVDEFLEGLDQLPRKGFKSGFIDLHEAINGRLGTKFLGPLNKKTSSGRILKGKKIDHLELIGLSETGSYVYGPSAQLKEEVEKLEIKIARGEPVFDILTEVPKDEPRKKGKSARIFSVQDFATFLVTKMMLANVVEFILCNKEFFECQVGMNAASHEWGKFAEWLRAFGDGVIAGDQAAYDMKVQSDLMLAAFMVLIKVARYLGYCEDEITKIWTFLSCVPWRFLLINADMVLFGAGNPSGWYLTSVVNSLMNSLIVRLCFRNALKRQGVSLRKFRDCVRLGTFGDDNIMTVIKELIKFFNFLILVAEMALLGFVYTSENKDGSEYTVKSLTEASFLKRTFVYDEARQLWLAPLEKESIFKSLCWQVASKSVPPEVQLHGAVLSANREWWMYPREVFEREHTRLLDVWESRKLVCLGGNLESFDELSAAYENGSYSSLGL